MILQLFRKDKMAPSVNLLNKSLSIYFLETDLYENITWSEITEKYKVFQRYSLNIEDLNKLYFTERVMSSLVHYIEKKLPLKVNKARSQVAYHRRVKSLGYSFYKMRGKCRLRIHPQSVTKMKAKIKALTSRSNGWGNEHRKEKLRQYITGWTIYLQPEQQTSKVAFQEFVLQSDNSQQASWEGL